MRYRIHFFTIFIIERFVLMHTESGLWKWLFRLGFIIVFTLSLSRENAWSGCCFSKEAANDEDDLLLKRSANHEVPVSKEYGGLASGGGINGEVVVNSELREEEEDGVEHRSPKTPKATSNSNGGALIVRKSPWKLRRHLNAAPVDKDVLQTVQSTTSTHVCSVDEAVRKAGFQDAELEFDEIDEVLDILTEYRDSTRTKALGSDADYDDPLTLQFKSLVGMYDAIIGHLESLKNAMNTEADSVAEELEHTACNVSIKMGFNPHSDGQKLLIQITYKSGFNPGEDSEGTFVQEFTRFISIFNPLGAIDGLGHDDIRNPEDFGNEEELRNALAIGDYRRVEEED